MKETLQTLLSPLLSTRRETELVSRAGRHESNPQLAAGGPSTARRGFSQEKTGVHVLGVPRI